MPEKKPYLCAGCPGKGDIHVDYDVVGSCAISTADSFRQTRRYRLFSPGDYSSNEEMAELSASGLQYYDPEEDDFYEERGDLRAARLGIMCAERFLSGLCPKSEGQMLRESEID